MPATNNDQLANCKIGTLVRKQGFKGQEKRKAGNVPPKNCLFLLLLFLLALLELALLLLVASGAALAALL